jgi:hypothetical protein
MPFAVLMPFGWGVPAAHQQAQKPVTRDYQAGQWRLKVTRDPFTGTTTCQLRAKDVIVDHATATFRFGRNTPTYGAVYKIDQGPAVSWQANAMTLATGGAALQSDNLENPSDGRVLVPLGALSGAHQITIRPSDTTQPRVFGLDRLAEALTGLRTLGCGWEVSGHPPDAK